jgi:RNA polymerase sigma-70 factor, ECF subfamily
MGQTVVDAARSGDQLAFRELAEQYRSELLAHCYRMLGSMQDAEDAFQETMLRAWRGLPRFEGRSSVRTWLYQIATNFCLDVLEERSRRMVPLEYGPPSDQLPPDAGAPLVESVSVEPAPDARYEQHEAVELAFIAALQHLPATQRAVLVLRDVLGFSAREVSDWFDTTVASVNSSLQRARKTVDERLPERSQQPTLRSLGDAQIGEVVNAYVAAWRKGDVNTLCALLAKAA